MFWVRKEFVYLMYLKKVFIVVFLILFEGREKCLSEDGLIE